jgi:AcrR family transcriptional regulator
VATDLGGFAARLLINATGRHRRSALAWCEIILDAARTPEGHALADSWFSELLAVWGDLAGAMPGARGEHDVETAIDTMIGLLFITLPLDLTSARLSAVLTGGGDPAREWAPPSAHPITDAPPPTRRTNKARETRERILGGAIDVLIAQGAGAITYNAVAAQSALTTAAPAYHFGSIEGLLKAAEAELFARSKGRYRDMVTSAQVTGAPLDVLADLTAAVFVREVTQHGRAAIAIYSIGLESSRRLELRPAVWDVIMDQTKAWKRRLELLVPEAGPLEAMRMQAVFIGKQVRALSTGSPLAHLALARGEFRSAIIANTK